MRLLPVALALLLAGCAGGPGHEAERWTFTQRGADGAAEEIAENDGFAVSIDLLARGDARQIGGQWHATLAAGVPVTLRFEASTNITVEWRAKAGSVAASGRCDWGPEGATKEISLGSATMRNTQTSCEVVFTPNAEIRDDEQPPFRWEARSAEAPRDGWALRFTASR